MRGYAAFFVLTAFLAGASSATTLRLAEGGSGTAQIVLCNGAVAADKTAAKELAAYLGEAVGTAFPVVSEAEAAPDRVHLYVGATVKAKEAGIDSGALGPEEWAIRTHGNDLVLAGGRPRGTLYAVYHFLEDEVGVHWWNPYEESVPKTPDLSVGEMNRHGKPTFRYRDIYMLYGGDNGRFAARNRLNRDGDAGIGAEYGGEMGYGPPYHVHTFNAYFPPDKYFAAHPEWYSLINGQRQKDMSQLCLTNAALRAAFVEKLKAYIAGARDDAERRGQPAPTVFDISQNDWEGMCQCDACQAITKAEGSESGPLLDFLNYLADAIKDECPGVCIDSLAYMMTQKPPKTLRPRDNLILRLCDTGSNFTKPVTDPENTPFREHLMSWAAITKNLRLWNYAVTYAPHYGLPMPSVHTYPTSYQFYAEHNVEGVFTEHEYPVLADLRDFKIWMMMKMLEDPYQDYGKQVRIFMDGFYGPAGETLHTYLDRLEKAAQAKPGYLSMGASPHQYHYLDLAFVQNAQGLFDQAETLVKDDSVLLRRVRHARLPLDRATLVLYRDLVAQWHRAGNDPAAFPLDRDAVGERCRDTWRTQVEFRIAPVSQAAALAEMETELKPLLARAVNTPLPVQFRDTPAAAIYDYTADLSRNYQEEAKRVPDAEAESGVSNRLELSDEDMKRYTLPMPWGLYDTVNKRVPGTAVIHAEDIPGSGYHWYRLGTFPMGQSYYVYFFWSWVIQFDLDNAVDPEHPDQSYEVWASIKFEGPGFPHAKPDQKNAICVERVILKKLG